MKIAAPLRRIEEVAPLAAAGADEFYCGFEPDEWVRRFGVGTLNRRSVANIATLDELAGVVEAAHAVGKSVSLTLNAQKYSAEQSRYILELADRLSTVGVHAVLVGDTGLLAMLCQGNHDFAVHVSSVASCRNSEAAKLYRDLGARRIILPRHVALHEIGQMVAAVPGMEFEVFALNDGCVFEEGLCHTIHLPPDKGGPICLDDYACAYARVDGGNLSQREVARFEEHERDYGLWLWYQFACGFTMTEQGLPHGPCALCAMAVLRRMGVAALKIVGREAGFARKLRSVQMLKAVLERIEAGAEDLEIAAFAQGLRGKPELCDSGYMCYYPEVLAQLASAPPSRPGAAPPRPPSTTSS